MSEYNIASPPCSNQECPTNCHDEQMRSHCRTFINDEDFFVGRLVGDCPEYIPLKLKMAKGRVVNTTLFVFCPKCSSGLFPKLAKKRKTKPVVCDKCQHVFKVRKV